MAAVRQEPREDARSAWTNERLAALASRWGVGLGHHYQQREPGKRSHCTRFWRAVAFDHPEVEAVFDRADLALAEVLRALTLADQCDASSRMRAAKGPYAWHPIEMLEAADLARPSGWVPREGHPRSGDQGSGIRDQGKTGEAR